MNLTIFRESRLARLARGAVVTGTSIFLLMYAGVALLRIDYQFELEWMEGGSLDHVARILEGRPLYGPPTLEFVPFIYSPGYFYVSAAVASLTGPGFLPLRLVSFFSSLGCFLLIFLIVRRETGSRFASATAVGLFAATYKSSGAWLDLARVDSLFLLFLLVSVYVHLPEPTRTSAILAGGFVSLSFLTKQTALVAIVAMTVHWLWHRRRLAAYFIGTTVLALGMSTLLLDWIHRGWYRYYLLLPADDLRRLSWLISFWQSDVLSALPVPVGFAVLAVAGRQRGGQWERAWFYTLLAAGMLGGGWISQLRTGGFANVLLPAHAVLAILLGIGMSEALKLGPPAGESERSLLHVFVCGLCLVQFGMLLYDPVPLIPRWRDWKAGARIVERIAQVDGDVLLPLHPYLVGRAGKRVFLSGNAGGDVLRGRDGAVRRKFVEELRGAIQGQRFGAIILDSPGPDWSRFLFFFQADIAAHYQVQGTTSDDPDVFWPVTGMPTRPEVILVPKKRE